MVRNGETGKLEMFHEIAFNHDWPARLQSLHRAAVAAYQSYMELEDLVPSEFAPPPAGTRQETVQLAASAWFQVSAISDAGCLALAEWYADTGAEVDPDNEAFAMCSVCGGEQPRSLTVRDSESAPLCRRCAGELGYE